MEENKNTAAPENAESITEQTVSKATESVPEEIKVPSVPPHKEYAARMVKFRDYYIQLLWCVGAGVALGVALAVIYNVIVGACVTILSAVVYGVFTYDEMLKRVGIGYKSIEGGIRVTACRAVYGEVLWIPQSIIWFNITEIGDRAFESEKNRELKKVFFPKTVTKIGSDIFAGCESICEIYFEGDEEQWETIEKETDFTSVKVIFEAKYPPIPSKKKKNSKSQKKPDKQGK